MDRHLPVGQPLEQRLHLGGLGEPEVIERREWRGRRVDRSIHEYLCWCA
jgi:hypothetical protein